MAKKIAKPSVKTTVQPKKLSKAGEWLKANPKGLGVVIHDMKAVMR